MGCLDIKLVLYHHTTHLVSSSIDHSPQFQILCCLFGQDTNLSHHFQSDTHYPSFLDTNRFQLVFEHLYSPVAIKLQLLKRVKQFQLGMESIRLTLVKILLLFSCCELIAFLTFLLSCLSFLHMPPLVCQVVIWLKRITSSLCRSENLIRIVIDSQLDSNAFLSLSF